MDLTIRITHKDLTQTYETRTLEAARATIETSGKAVLDLIKRDIDMYETGSSGWEEIVSARCLIHYERRNLTSN